MSKKKASSKMIFKRMSKRHNRGRAYAGTYQKTLTVPAKKQEKQMDEVREKAKKFASAKTL